MHASVIASLGNGDFYLSCGFDNIVGDCTAGESNPPAEVVGGSSIIFMWPESKEAGDGGNQMVN